MKVEDRNGWRLVPGARIRLYMKGRKTKRQGVVLLVTDGSIAFTDLKTHGVCHARPSDCEVMGGNPDKLRRFKVDQLIIQEAAAISRRRLGRSRR